jgi:co-chaperonin GroES (HSP10)
VIDILRIYKDGWLAADFLAVKSNLHIVEPVVPKAAEGERDMKTAGGIIVPGHATTDKIPGTAALIYRIARKADAPGDGALGVDVGDLVTLRNAMLDPLGPKQTHHTIDALHIVAIVERAAAAATRVRERSNRGVVVDDLECRIPGEP